jgi:hypothetical protein
MPSQFLKALLEECEREHRASGLPASDWSAWYAAYMSPRIAQWTMDTYGSFAGPACPYAPRTDGAR